jgi:hypothetical protein
MQENTKITDLQWINSTDYEREAQKEFIYLYEAQQLIEQQYWEDVKRKAAHIFVSEESKKLLENESKTSDILPF